LPPSVIVIVPAARLARTRSSTFATESSASARVAGAAEACGVELTRSGAGTAGAERTGGVSSSRIVFRALRTAYSYGRASDIRTRASALPSTGTACSSETAEIGSRRSRTFAASATETLRNSTRTVNGPGRVTTYETGSVASMMS
jgi:hypothetical protein